MRTLCKRLLSLALVLLMVAGGILPSHAEKGQIETLDAEMEFVEKSEGSTQATSDQFQEADAQSEEVDIAEQGDNELEQATEDISQAPLVEDENTSEDVEETVEESTPNMPNDGDPMEGSEALEPEPACSTDPAEDALETDDLPDTLLLPVIFEYDDGSTPLRHATVLKGEKIEKPDNPKRAGYRFMGWAYAYEVIDEDTMIPLYWDFDTPLDSDEGLWLTAVWKKELPVVFEYDDGSTPLLHATVLQGERIKKPDNPKRAGYRFMGWAYAYEVIDEDTMIPLYWDFDTPLNADRGLWLTAVWKREFTVVFDPNGGKMRNSDSRTVRVLDGDLVKKPGNPKREGYDFVGWAYTYEDSAPLYWNFAKQTVDRDGYVLVAVWKKAGQKDNVPKTGEYDSLCPRAL